MNVVDIVLESHKEAKGKKSVESSGFKAQHDRTVATLDGADAEVFSAVWNASTTLVAMVRDKEFRDWNDIKTEYHQQRKLLQPTLKNLKQEIEIYVSFVKVIEAVIFGNAPKQWQLMNMVQLPKQVNQPQLDMAEQLKQIYMSQMSIDAQEDIHTIDDMFDIYVDNMDARSFYDDVVEPICDVLPSMNSCFIKIDHETFEVSAEYVEPTFKQFPDMSSLPNLFAQALAVHTIVVVDAIDNDRGGLYSAMVSRGIWDGSYQEFELAHPTPKERKEKIFHELLHTLGSAMRTTNEFTKTEYTKEFVDASITLEDYIESGTTFSIDGVDRRVLNKQAKKILKLFEKFLRSKSRYYR